MNDLEKHVLEMIGEDIDSPDVFTDTTGGMAQIRDSINDAIEEITMLTGSVKRRFFVPLEEDRCFYRLTFTKDRFGWVTGAWAHGSNWRLEQTDLHRLYQFNPRWMYDTGTPQSYFTVGYNVIGFWPTPASSERVIEIDAVVIPSRYTSDADRIKLREEFQGAVVHYAVGEYYASRGDAQQALYHLQQYVEKLGIQEMYPQAPERVYYYRTNKEYWPRPTG